MTSLLTLKPDPQCSYQTQAHPSAYSEAGRAQFNSVPGVKWIKDPNAPNSRGYYLGAKEAIEIAAKILEEAEVCRVNEEVGVVFSSSWSPELPYHTRTSLTTSLRTYQVDGAKWIAQSLHDTRGALLGDDMGLGKTPQAIVGLDMVLGATHERLVICPAVVVSHWQRLISHWAYAPQNWRVLSYEKFVTASKGGSKKISALSPGISAVVIDEGHYFSNPKAKRTKAFREWISKLEIRPMILMLTGTPMNARPRDLHEPLDILWPGRMGSWFAFTRRYCDGHYEEIPKTEKTFWKSEGISRASELGSRMRVMMLRRTKAQVKEQLPKLSRVILEIEIPPKARKDLAKSIATIEGLESGRNLSQLLSNVEDHKIKAALELAEDLRANGRKTLIVTTRRDTAHQIGAALGAPVVTGDVAPDKRKEILGSSDLGVATMYSVTTGIDLVNYDTMIFVGLDWLPTTLLQVEGRLHRIGQELPVTIYYLIGLGTADEIVREKVVMRLGACEEILGSEDTNMRGDLQGSDEDLLAGIVTALRMAA